MNKDKKLKLIQQLSEILQELNWVVAIPQNDDPCQGLIVGELDYVTDVINAYYGDDVEVLQPNNGNDDEPIINEDETKH